MKNNFLKITWKKVIITVLLLIILIICLRISKNYYWMFPFSNPFDIFKSFSGITLLFLYVIPFWIGYFLLQIFIALNNVMLTYIALYLPTVLWVYFISCFINLFTNKIFNIKERGIFPEGFFRRYKISVLAIIFIILLLLIVSAELFSIFNINLVDSNAIKGCFNKNSVQELKSCVSSSVGTTLNVNNKLDIGDIPSFCKNVSQESFQSGILTDSTFANFISSAGFNKRDYCYVYLMSDWAIYSKYGTGDPKEEMKIVFGDKLKVCNLLSDETKRNFCLIYGFRDINDYCQTFMPNCVARCNLIKNNDEKNLCLNIAFCKIGQYCLP